MTPQNGVAYPEALTNRFLTAMNVTAFDAILALDEAHRYLVLAGIESAAPAPSGQWNRLLAQLSLKAELLESSQSPAHFSAHADLAEDDRGRTDRVACDLFIAAAAFLAAEANDLEDRIELLPDEHREKGVFFRSCGAKVILRGEELTPVRLSDVVDEVGHTASTFINWIEQGEWRQYTDRAAFARRWADEIADSVSYMAIEHEELVRRMLGFVHQLVEAALGAEPDSIVGRQIGTDIAQMIIACFADVIPPTLDKTRPLIVACLPKLLGQAPHGFDVAKRVQHLTDNMATAYSRALDKPRQVAQHKRSSLSRRVPRSLVAAALVLVAIIGTLSLTGVPRNGDSIAKTEFMPIVNPQMIPSPNSNTCNFSLFISAYGSGTVEYLVSQASESKPLQSGNIPFTGNGNQMSGKTIKIRDIAPGDSLSTNVVVPNSPIDKNYIVSCERKIQG